MRAVALIASAAGECGMVAGQAADIIATGKHAPTADVEAIHSKKTGALIRACAEAGALVGGAGEKDAFAFRAYGELIGLMFQIADDVKDATATLAEMGKRTHKDAEMGKPSYVAAYGLEGAKKRLRELSLQAVEKVENVRAASPFFAHAAEYFSQP
jgi:geranylgeranyl pyrophosphate synthase